MIQPHSLKPGDRVAILSPANPITAPLLVDGLRMLESWGLEVVLCEDVYARRPHADYLAGDDQCRSRALHRALSDPSISAVICSRGGYGTMRLLPHLDTETIRRSPKLLVGFSDITALHVYFAGVLGMTTLHGPVVKSLHLHRDDPHESLGHLQAALFGTRPTPFHVGGLRTVRPGKAQGRLIGGNLSLIVNLLASDYCPPLRGMVLILEEIGEVDYRLDRLFTALRLAQKARGLAGIVLGDFTDCSGVYVPEDHINHFVDDLAGEFGCPVVADFPCGHGSRNVPVPMGVEVALDADAGRLTFLGDAVAALV